MSILAGQEAKPEGDYMCFLTDPNGRKELQSWDRSSRTMLVSDRVPAASPIVKNAIVYVADHTLKTFREFVEHDRRRQKRAFPE